jgi:hypothetical protein
VKFLTLQPAKGLVVEIALATVVEPDRGPYGVQVLKLQTFKCPRSGVHDARMSSNGEEPVCELDRLGADKDYIQDWFRATRAGGIGARCW